MPSCVYSALVTHGSRSPPNGAPSAASVAHERARAERLVTHGSRRAWRSYLAEALALAGSCSGGPEVAEARAVVEDVVHNHNQLELAQ